MGDILNTIHDNLQGRRPETGLSQENIFSFYNQVKHHNPAAI